MSLSDRIDATQRFDRARFIPFVADDAVIGFVRRDFVDHLRPYHDVLSVDEGAVSLRAPYATFDDRSRAMADVARSLAARGLLSKWRGETYEIGAGEGRAACFVLERAAVRFFGFTARAVHLNGLVRHQAAVRMWIATRSADKAIDPGMYDNLVGGGIARGLSIEQTLVKEAWEEAGIGTELALQSRAAGMLHVCREVPDGLHAEIIYGYDLWLPPDFAPSNQDGEVAEFRLLNLECVARELAGDAPYTIDAAYVALNCLSRWMPGFRGRINSRG